jgi:outer membrane receptor for Fe3+-dicitrate
LLPNIAITASYVHKYTDESVGWKDVGGVYGTRDVLLANGQTLTTLPLLNAPSQRLFQRTNGPGYFVHYNGLLMSLNKRLTHRWQAAVQYTYSRAYGLQTGSISSTANPAGQDPNDLINYTGRLIPQDRPHMVRAEASYMIPKLEINVGTAIEDISGMALTPTTLVSLPPGQRSIAIAPPGTYRTPRVQLINMQFDKTIFKQGDHRLTLTAQIFNLFQDDAYETVTTTNFFSSGFLTPSTWLPARYLKFGAKFVF